MCVCAGGGSKHCLLCNRTEDGKACRLIMTCVLHVLLAQIGLTRFFGGVWHCRSPTQ